MAVGLTHTCGIAVTLSTPSAIVTTNFLPQQILKHLLGAVLPPSTNRRCSGCCRETEKGMTPGGRAVGDMQSGVVGLFLLLEKWPRVSCPDTLKCIERLTS